MDVTRDTMSQQFRHPVAGFCDHSHATLENKFYQVKVSMQYELEVVFLPGECLFECIGQDLNLHVQNSLIVKTCN